MKSTLKTLSVLLISVACLFNTGCKTEPGDITYVEKTAPNIEIVESGKATTSEISVIFKPGSAATSYSYGIGTEADRKNFADGTLSTYKNVTGNSELAVTFDNLQSGRHYWIYGKAVNAEGKSAGISAISIRTDINGIVVTEDYIGDNCAAYRVYIGGNYIDLEFAFGDSPSDKTKFELGAEEGGLPSYEKHESVMDWTANLWNAEPGSTHYLFARGKTRTGETTETSIIEVNIKEKGSVPGLDFSILHNDNYMSNMRFVPNANTSQLIISIVGQDSNEESMYYFSKAYDRGDIMYRMKQWIERGGTNYYTGTNGPIDLPRYNTSSAYTGRNLKPNSPIHVYVTSFSYETDSKDNYVPVNVNRYEFNSPEVDETLPDATVSIGTGTITSNSASFPVTANAASLGFYWTIVTESEANSSTWATDSSVIQNIQSKSWAHSNGGDNPATVSASGLDRVQKYYLIILPVNKNGNSGFGKPVKKDFMTAFSGR